MGEELTDLERAMKELLEGAGSAAEAGKKTSAEAGKIRRKSRDLEEQLGEMGSAQVEANAHRSRRGSRDYTEEELEAAFAKIDTDGSGQIDEKELMTAVNSVDPKATETQVKDYLKAADKNSDGQISLSEFKNIMKYRPSTA